MLLWCGCRIPAYALIHLQCLRWWTRPHLCSDKFSMRALGISCVSGAGVELPLTLLSSTHPMQNATGTTILCQVNRLGGFLFAMQKQACTLAKRAAVALQRNRMRSSYVQPKMALSATRRASSFVMRCSRLFPIPSAPAVASHTDALERFLGQSLALWCWCASYSSDVCLLTASCTRSLNCSIRSVICCSHRCTACVLPRASALRFILRKFVSLFSVALA